MVTQQILVLLFLVRIQVAQHKERISSTKTKLKTNSVRFYVGFRF